jgi:Arc/MetJ-type ribon-helix-helix transcriptional regulator
MRTKKIVVSLPEEQIAAARRAVAEGSVPSVSIYVSQALAAWVADDDVKAMVTEIYAELGQPDTSDRSWARQALGMDQ